MKLIRSVMCAVVMGNILNVMAMETETIEQKRAKAVARYKENKKLVRQDQKNYWQPIVTEGNDCRPSSSVFMGVPVRPRLPSFLPQPFFDEEWIQDLSLIEKSDSQEEKDKALHRFVRIEKFHQSYEYWETFKKSIKTVVQKGADPNLENDTKYVGEPLYIAMRGFKYKKDIDLLQFLFAHGARTDLPKAAVWVREVFEEYNKNQEKLKNESIHN